MNGNSFGNKFKITTFGESHGRAVGVIIDGVEPGLKITEKEIQKELDRRKPGQSVVTSRRMECDKLEIISGIYNDKSLGTPICMLVWNEGQNSGDYENLKNIFRPGHADYSYFAKYGIYDHRGGGRASGRETIGRVAAGAVAKKILLKRNIKILGYTREIGGIKSMHIDYSQIEKNPLRCPDPVAAKKMEKKILEIIKKGDSLGGVVEIVIKGCPTGLGDPVFNKIDAELAKAMVSIPGVKGFEIGSGFQSASMRGSEHNDEFYYDKKNKRFRTKTNNAGGVLGGITIGEDIVLRLAVKPTSSISLPQQTVDIKGFKKTFKIEGRHDPCLCPRIVPVAEAMAAIVMVNFIKR